ncbi:MAG: PadR family transcriptional regulator, partial [Promethearchaeota archaeon]
KQLTQTDSYISDSSLYTTLRSLEKKYGLLSSKMEERRRYYFLTDLGSQITDQAFTHWLKLVQEGNLAIKKLNLH